MVEGTLGYVCLTRSTDAKVDYRQGQCTGSLKQGVLNMVERFVRDHLQTLQGCVAVLRVSHAIEPFTEIIQVPLRRFYQNRFYSDR